MTATAAAAAAARATATATPTTMTMISESYRAWQVPSLESKGAAIRLFLFKLTSMMTVMMTGAATTTATATATAMTMGKISQSYRAWQVPALGSKGAAIRLFLFKHSDHVKNDGDDDNDSDSSSISQSYRAWQVSAL